MLFLEHFYSKMGNLTYSCYFVFFLKATIILFFERICFGNLQGFQNRRFLKLWILNFVF
jgi:hypothetical protein